MAKMKSGWANKSVTRQQIREEENNGVWEAKLSTFKGQSASEMMVLAEQNDLYAANDQLILAPAYRYTK